MPGTDPTYAIVIHRTYLGAHNSVFVFVVPMLPRYVIGGLYRWLPTSDFDNFFVGWMSSPGNNLTSKNRFLNSFMTAWVGMSSCIVIMECSLDLDLIFHFLCPWGKGSAYRDWAMSKDMQY